MQQIFQQLPNEQFNQNTVLQQPIQQVDQKPQIFGNLPNNMQNLQLQQNKTAEQQKMPQYQPSQFQQNNFQLQPQTHQFIPQKQINLNNMQIINNQTPQGIRANNSGNNLLQTEPVPKTKVINFLPQKKIIQGNLGFQKGGIFDTEQLPQKSQKLQQQNFNQFQLKQGQLPSFKQPESQLMKQQILNPNQQLNKFQQNQNNQQIEEENKSVADSQMIVNGPFQKPDFEPKQRPANQQILTTTKFVPQQQISYQFSPNNNGVKNVIFTKGQEFPKFNQQIQQVVQESKIVLGNQGQANIIQQFPEQNNFHQQQNISFPLNHENKKIKIANKDYEICKLLGQGSFGSVYLVEDEQKEKFALKIQKTIKQAEMEILQRFKVKKFKNLVNTIAVQSDRISNEYYVLMEYCETSLQDYILFKRLDPDQCRYIVKQIALGIKELHDLGIIHRDIKPENILIFEKKDPQNPQLTQKLYKICDFGLSCLKDYSKTTELGTAHYMPPEQIQGIGYDRSVDIWALGTVIFEIFTGQVMFYAKNRKEIFEQIINISQDEINDNVSKVLCLQNENYEELVKEMLNKDSKKRPTIDQVLERLTSKGEKKPFSHHQPNISPQPHEDQQRKKRSQSGN